MQYMCPLLCNKPQNENKPKGGFKETVGSFVDSLQIYMFTYFATNNKQQTNHKNQKQHNKQTNQGFWESTRFVSSAKNTYL